jgi:hypothetical protein
MLRLKITAQSTWCVLIGLVFALYFVSAMAQEQAASAPWGREIVFDIPSQGLATALTAYAAASGTQVLYETSLTAGRNSAAVSGRFTPEAALQALLADTGLVGRRTDVDAVTILPEARTREAGAPSVTPDAPFLGALQAGILSALCGAAETRPGQYRMALQLWITADGVIRRVSLLASTGDARRDAALAKRLPGVSIGSHPPPGMNQPVTLAIVPRSPLQRPECDSG